MFEAPGSETVLIWTRSHRDAQITAQLLEREGLEALLCENLQSLCAAIESGAGVALLSEDVLVPASCARCAAAAVLAMASFIAFVMGMPGTFSRSSNAASKLVAISLALSPPSLNIEAIGLGVWKSV